MALLRQLDEVNAPISAALTFLIVMYVWLGFECLLICCIYYKADVCESFDLRCCRRCCRETERNCKGCKGELYDWVTYYKVFN